MIIELYPKTQLERAWEEDKQTLVSAKREVPHCLRCGRILDPQLQKNALSRYVDVYVCENCGIDEAMRDVAHRTLPLAEWEAVKNGRISKKNNTDCCYLVTCCDFEEIFRNIIKLPMMATKRPVSEIVYSRSDYDGNRWWTTWQNGRKEKPAQEVVKEIDDFQHALFSMPEFETLNSMIQFCSYARLTDEPTKFNLYAETKYLYIWIQLNTRFKDYNVYVHYFEKDIEENK